MYVFFPDFFLSQPIQRRPEYNQNMVALNVTRSTLYLALLYQINHLSRYSSILAYLYHAHTPVSFLGLSSSWRNMGVETTIMLELKLY